MSRCFVISWLPSSALSQTVKNFQTVSHLKPPLIIAQLHLTALNLNKHPKKFVGCRIVGCGRSRRRNSVAAHRELNALKSLLVSHNSYVTLCESMLRGDHRAGNHLFMLAALLRFSYLTDRKVIMPVNNKNTWYLDKLFDFRKHSQASTNNQQHNNNTENKTTNNNTNDEIQAQTTNDTNSMNMENKTITSIET
ncbi:hypothetical protein HELRODRAFT_158793 [Helobdella robusta]|uniref:Uncharacterized protein n=1 Tax=Helobdella robusta TaxID=6412 RepID=T1EN97_HELRO|nr:hypothetical protein HELRODRAFT_158793 [Helobdella robusta]ESO12306.1 hypothetical protein HELRODRAFT_158793 [Helobdella robusta]